MEEPEYTPEQIRAMNRLRRAINACQQAGLILVADMDIIGIRILTPEIYRDCDDLRQAEGETISLTSACGGNSTRGACAGITMPMHT